MRTIFLFLCAASLPLMGFEQENLIESNAAPTTALKRLFFLLDIPQESNLNNLVSATQMRWIQTGKERWEFELIEEDKKEHLIPIFKQIGLYDEVPSSRAEYDYALIYGGFYSRVLNRIEYLISEYRRGVRFNTIVLLTGQRTLDPNTEEKQLPFQTETEMMLFCWKNAVMPEEMRKIPLQLVDAPKQLKIDGSWVRPNTKDTLIEWLKTQPISGSCLCVSSQPFCGYQDSVAKTYFPSSFSIETIGMKSEQNLPISVYLDNLARWLYQEKIRRGV